MADKKSRQIIRQAKQKNNESIVVATGCYAQVSKEELEKIEELDIIIGNSEKNNIVHIVENYSNDFQRPWKSGYLQIHLWLRLSDSRYLTL